MKQLRRKIRFSFIVICCYVAATSYLWADDDGTSFYRIYSDGIGEIRIGDPLSSVAVLFEGMGYKVQIVEESSPGKQSGVWVYDSSGQYLFFGSKERRISSSSLIKDIYIYSSNFYSSNGLRVGSRLSDFDDDKKITLLESEILSKPRIWLNREFFLPDATRTYRVIWEMAIVIYSKVDEEVHEINGGLSELDGVIKYFHIFEW